MKKRKECAMLNTNDANCTHYVAPFVISMIQSMAMGLILHQLHVVGSDLQVEWRCDVRIFLVISCTAPPPLCSRLVVGFDLVVITFLCPRAGGNLVQGS